MFDDEALEDANTSTFTLQPEQECRLEVAHNQSITLQLTSGKAEVFGCELAPGSELVLSGKKLAVFSWHGCELQGECSVSYVAGDTPMPTYLNVHLALEQKRDSAAEYNGQGPKVMVLGPSDVGKTSLCKILLNYAVRQGHTPLFIDLDTNEATVAVPGTLTATSITRLVDPVDDFSSTALTTTSTPLALYYGYSSPLEKKQVYEMLVDRLGNVLDQRLATDEKGRKAGLIVNAPSQFVDPNGQEMLLHAINALQVDVIVVIGHERLYADLARRFEDDQDVSVIKLAKSGGVVDRDKAFRKASQNAKIREYFYGSPRSELSPYNSLVSFGDVFIRRIADGHVAPSSALPLGSEAKKSEIRFLNVEPGDILLHSILAVSTFEVLALEEKIKSNTMTPEDEAQMLLGAATAGFIYISEVDETKKKLTVLAPNPGRLPKNVVFMGALKWIETQ